jgi:hypothetical protein
MASKRGFILFLRQWDRYVDVSLMFFYLHCDAYYVHPFDSLEYLIRKENAG